MVTKTKPKKASRRGKRTRFGVITPDEVFTVDAFLERLGIERETFAKMRDRGLVARRDGGKYLRVLGSDYLNYVNSLPAADATTKPKS